jgi:hypothetical protein
MTGESIEKSSDGASIVVEPISADNNYARHNQDDLEFDDEHLEKYPNWWSKYRYVMSIFSLIHC